MVRSQSESLTPVTSISIDNAAPTIATSEIKICAGDVATSSLSACTDISEAITLSAGATDQNTIVFIVRDGNGTQDLDSIAEATFFHSGTTNACTSDNNNCYGGGGSARLQCPFAESITATSARYRCDLVLEYYTDQSIDSGSWNTFASIGDSSGETGTQSVSDEGIDKLIAGTFANISYGTESLGYVTGVGEEIQVSHYNNGNVVLDFDILANSDLACSILGTMPATSFKFDAVPNQAHSGAYTLSTIATIEFDTLDSVVRTDDTSTTNHVDTSYWSVQVPSAGLSGTCNATITVVSEESV